MIKKYIAYIDELDIEDQLPPEPDDVFQLYKDNAPQPDHVYSTEPARLGTVVVRYKIADHSQAAANIKASRYMKRERLKPYHAFQTATYYCWYAVKETYE